MADPQGGGERASARRAFALSVNSRSPAAAFDFRKGSKEGGLFGASFGLSGLRVGELESVKILLESRYSVPGVGR